MVKSAAQVKKQILFWYLKYHGKQMEQVTGLEAFTVFDLIPEAEKEYLRRRVVLNRFELPVLLTRIEPGQWILNTTERFTRITDHSVESIAYKSFFWHAGPLEEEDTIPKLLAIKLGLKPKPVNPKVAGAIMPFGLRLTDENTVYWPMPTGSPMFGFWNVTKHCELIGRKYEIEEYTK